MGNRNHAKLDGLVPASLCKDFAGTLSGPATSRRKAPRPPLCGLHAEKVKAACTSSENCENAKGADPVFGAAPKTGCPSGTSLSFDLREHTLGHVITTYCLIQGGEKGTRRGLHYICGQTPA